MKSIQTEQQQFTKSSRLGTQPKKLKHRPATQKKKQKLASNAWNYWEINKKTKKGEQNHDENL